MKKTINYLKRLFLLELFLPLLVVVIYELGIIHPGLLCTNIQINFVFKIIMELLTISVIPLALRMFKIKRIEIDLSKRKEDALKEWGTIRLLSLGIVLFFNTLFYYLFLSTEYGYLAIILLISMVFIYPSKEKCFYETRDLTR